MKKWLLCAEDISDGRGYGVSTVKSNREGEELFAGIRC